MAGTAELLRRHRALTIAGLAVLALLAWLWIISGAGMGMAARAEFLALPHSGSTMTMPMAWDPPRIAITLAMWWVMMIAMMIPAAAPVVLLYLRAAPSQGVAKSRPGPFVVGYLLCWLAFSGVAVTLQFLFEQTGLLDAMTMSTTSQWLAGSVLVAAGLYQLSPAKSACLSHCRNPADFLASHFRPGPFGALRMGLAHGAYCVGCCWLLMGLLFVVGIMNLAWIAVLTILVAAEKLLPGGRRLARVGGAFLVFWGIAILIAG